MPAGRPPPDSDYAALQERVDALEMTVRASLAVIADSVAGADRALIYSLREMIETPDALQGKDPA